jgi:carboxyl-terminal processing protease
VLRCSEGLGPRRFRGRVIILVNEHTASAGEMVVAFAEENNLVNRTRRKDSGPTAERQRV